MDKLKSLLRETTEKTQSAQAALDREHSALGAELLDERVGDGASEELKELLAAAQETRERIKKSQANTDRLMKLLSQQSETRGVVEEKEGELAILEDEIEPHYERVGRAAIEAMVDEQLESSSFRKSIGQLRGLETDIKQISRELSRGGTGESGKGVVTQAISGGRKLYLQGLLRTKELRSTGLYRRLGREICSTEAIEALDAPAFAGVLEPVFRYQEQKRKLDSHVSTLTNKIERLQADIVALCGNERPQRYLQRMENEREVAHDELSEKLRGVGALFAERAVGASSMAKDVKSLLASVKNVKKEIEALNTRRERVEAAIAVENLDRKVDSNRAKMRTLENTVKRANKEIEGLAGEIKGLNDEREALLRIRGSVDDLRLDPVEEE